MTPRNVHEVVLLLAKLVNDHGMGLEPTMEVSSFQDGLDYEKQFRVYLDTNGPIRMSRFVITVTESEV